MKIELGGDSPGLRVSFDTAVELEKFVADAKLRKSFILQLERQLALFDTLDCRLSTEDGISFSLPVEVLQVFERCEDASSPSFATAFRITDWKLVPEPQIHRRVLAAESENAPHAAEVSPIFRIRQMNPNERAILAMKGSRTERRILLRDTTPQVLMALLSHPRLEDKEVLAIVKSNYASAGILQRVAENRKWMQNRDIMLAVVRNPKTPPLMAQKLLPGLATRDLRVLAKMGNAREVLRKAALRLYLQRTKSTPGQV